MARSVFLILVLAAAVFAGPQPAWTAEELLAVVYEKAAEGAKGRRVHRQELLAAATEEHSATIALCGRQFYAYEAELEALRGFGLGDHVIVVYRSEIDPVTKNSRREELCRTDQ